MKVKTKKGLVFGIGGALIVIGCIIGGCWALIFRAILKSQLALTEDSTSFPLWQETPIPMYMDLYMWNWTNADAVLKDNTILPKLEQNGPYVFSEVHKKVNLTWNNNASVTFLQERWWQFEPDQSVGSLDDEIIGVDVIAATVASVGSKLPDVAKIVLNYAMKKLGKDVVIKKTAGEWLYDGYEDSLLDLAAHLNLTIDLPYTRFGWFADRNGSALYDGYHNMLTGTDDLDKLGTLHQWNFKEDTPFYEPPCNKIFGTLGELGPPMKGVNEISVFTSDFCTALTMYYTGDFDKQGVIGNKYSGTLNPFDYSDPKRRCYCPSVNGEPSCPANGVINVSKCKFGAPVYVSYPHFYLADESYGSKIEGLSPNKESHEFYLAIEPTSGIPLEVRGRLQINLLLDKFDGIEIYEKAPNIMIPTIWFCQRVDIPDKNSKQIKLIVLVPAIGMGTFFGIAGIGLLMVVIGVVLTVRKGWQGDDIDPLIPPRDE